MKPARNDITKDVVGRWPGVLSALGVDESYLANKHGPCPMCGGSDRYRFDDRDGRGTWICSKCGAGDGWKLLQAIRGVAFRDAAALVKEVLPGAPEVKVVRERDAESKRAALIATWKASKPIEHGDPVDTYLRKRGLSPVKTLRYQPATRYYEDGVQRGVYDAMVAVMVDPSGKGQSIHVTYLQDGEKANVKAAKKIMSPVSSINGCAVRLAPAGQRIGIAEGIETALAASELFQMPVWAATNANCLEAFVWPEGLSELIVFADNDESFTGHKAAYVLAQRAKARGLVVSVEVPAAPGQDWNDVLRERDEVATA